MKKYEFIEHTADIGLRVYGKTLEALFKNAAVALFSLLAQCRSSKSRERIIELTAATEEDLFVNWLNELISIFYTYKFLPCAYNILIEDSQKTKILTANIKGQIFSPYKNKVGMEIKAATYHNLKIERNRRGYKAEVIFDV